MNILRHIVKTGVAVLIATSTAYAGDAEHASSGGLPQFDPTWFASQIFWLIVSFTLLYLVFSKKTLPSISATIDRRRQKVESDMETTENLAKEAQETLEEYQENLKNSQIKARAVITKTETDLKVLSEDTQNNFRKKAEKTITKTEASIAEATESAMKEVRSIATEITIDVIKHITKQDVAKKDVDATVKKLAKTPKKSSKNIKPQAKKAA